MISPPDRMTAAITDAIRKEIDVIIEEEGERAAKAVRARLHASIATIALTVAQNYDITMERGKIVTRVRNEENKHD